MCAARAISAACPYPYPNTGQPKRGHLWSTRLSTSGSTAPSRQPKLRSKTKIVAGRRRRCRSGASTARAPTRRRATAATACSIPVFSCPDPIRGGKNVLVMCEVYSADGKPHPTNTRAALVKTAKKYAKHESLVRHRAGVHDLQGRPPARLPDRRLPGPAGRLLLRRRRGRDLRTRDRRGAPRRLPRRRPVDQRHQRRGDARPVGVPGRPARPARGRRPAVGRPLAALPHGRGLRRGRPRSTPSR